MNTKEIYDYKIKIHLKHETQFVLEQIQSGQKMSSIGHTWTEMNKIEQSGLKWTNVGSDLNGLNRTYLDQNRLNWIELN